VTLIVAQNVTNSVKTLFFPFRIIASLSLILATYTSCAAVVSDCAIGANSDGASGSGGAVVVAGVD
jgi:hypothetical protein